MNSLPQRPTAGNQQRWVRIGILIVGTIVFLSFLGLDPLLRAMKKRDYNSGVPQEGTAVVVDRRGPKLDEYDRPIPAEVTVRFQGKLYPTEKVFGFSELPENAVAHIVYRIGSSGRLYIDRVEPLKSARSPQSTPE